MKSIIKKTIYAGLGLVSDGADAVKTLGHELVRKANVTEAEGERLAREFHARSSKAVKSIRRTLDAEVTMVADAIHAAIREDVATKKSKPVATVKAASKTHAKARVTRTSRKAMRVR
jgi:polyhydroxyalkanoate synthesis regulator phasin